jgi:Zn-dependent oligopeptidase
MSRYDEKQNGFNQKELSQYFPAEHVKEATMDIYQELLGLTFKKMDKAETWHKLVTAYEVRDKKSNKKIGNFYLDLYPREDKFNHAAAMTLLKRAKVDNRTLLASAAMVTNFSPSKDGKPAVLPHSEVVTFFHEFGHVMHNMCNEANFDRFAGAQVERDFVEMPS